MTCLHHLVPMCYEYVFLGRGATNPKFPQWHPYFGPASHNNNANFFSEATATELGQDAGHLGASCSLPFSICHQQAVGCWAGLVHVWVHNGVGKGMIQH